MRGLWRAVVGVGLFLVGASGTWAQGNLHTDALNFDPVVRQAYEKFYNLDLDGALRIFNQVAQAHQQDPMAWDYVLVATVFRELYHQDLLDTTYYAHDSFLMNKRQTTVTDATRDQINALTDKVVGLCDARLKANGNDKDAYFARGYAKGIHAVFLILVYHQFSDAARQGLSARNDSEAALKIDPQYADAKMAVGIQQFAVASLPRWLRFVVGIMGVGGNKEQGLANLRDAGAHGTADAVESRTVLSLFLRHDGRYAEALDVQRGLAAQYPHNFVYRLEVANLLKDEGHGNEAMDEYKRVLADAAKPGYFTEPRLQMAWFGLGDTQKGYNLPKDSAQSFMNAATQPSCSDWLKRRAELNAGEEFDAQHDRGQAMHWYQLAAAPGGDQSQADAARKYMKTPFKAGNRD